MDKQTAKLLKQLSQVLFSTADNIERKKQPVVFSVITGIAVVTFLVATLL